jgi:hypothetical protein
MIRVYSVSLSLFLLIVFPIRAVVDLLVLCCILVRCRRGLVSSLGALSVLVLGGSFSRVSIVGFRGAGVLVRFGAFPRPAVSYASSFRSQDREYQLALPYSVVRPVPILFLPIFPTLGVISRRPVDALQERLSTLCGRPGLRWTREFFSRRRVIARRT